MLCRVGRGVLQVGRGAGRLGGGGGGRGVGGVGGRMHAGAPPVCIRL